MDAIRPQYEALGVDGYYAERGDSYRNPHEPIIAALLEATLRAGAFDLSQVLDLACGSGEATLVLQALGATVSGVDPYTGAAYYKRTGLAARALRFEDIAAGALETERYSLIVCSFALHLVPESWLPALTLRLAAIAETLIVLTPHKRPLLKPAWGFKLESETLQDRVRLRVYRSQVKG